MIVELQKLQTRKGSMFEVCFNLFFGVGTGWLTNMIVLPLFGFQVSKTDSLSIVLIFTTISFIRGYFVRRIFNWHQIKTNE